VTGGTPACKNSSGS